MVSGHAKAHITYAERLTGNHQPGCKIFLLCRKRLHPDTMNIAV